MTSTPAVIQALRSRISALERFCPRATGILPFGVEEIDAHLPENGLSRAALHEIAGSGDTGPATAALFAAGILARTNGPVLWCAFNDDIFAPGLACAGLPPDRVLHARAPDEKTVLLLMEEALRHPGLAAVLGELSRLPMTASRRLVLAAEKSGVTAIALRRPPERRAGSRNLPQSRSASFGNPTPQHPTLRNSTPRNQAEPHAEKPDPPNAATTRWRITSLPSSPLPTHTPENLGIGRARWCLELTRCRGGTPSTWIMEACDAQGIMRVPPDLAHRPAETHRILSSAA